MHNIELHKQEFLLAITKPLMIFKVFFVLPYFINLKWKLCAKNVWFLSLFWGCLYCGRSPIQSLKDTDVYRLPVCHTGSPNYSLTNLLMQPSHFFEFFVYLTAEKWCLIFIKCVPPCLLRSNTFPYFELIKISLPTLITISSSIMNYFHTFFAITYDRVFKQLETNSLCIKNIWNTLC